MKGSSISVRIADFLKEYPPFQFLDRETLRELASQAKVKFHEDQEIVFSQGQPRDQWIYVIQQGNVRILDESDNKVTLIDLRGPGDLLGLHGIRSEEPYQHTCRTDTETILYGNDSLRFAAQAVCQPCGALDRSATLHRRLFQPQPCLSLEWDAAAG